MTAWGPRTETALGTTPATRCPLLGQPLYVTFHPRTVHSTNLFIHVFIQNTNGRGRRLPLNQSAPRPRRSCPRSPKGVLRRRVLGRQKAAWPGREAGPEARSELGVASGHGVEPGRGLEPGVRGTSLLWGQWERNGVHRRPTRKRSSRICQRCCRRLRPRPRSSGGQRGRGTAPRRPRRRAWFRGAWVSGGAPPPRSPRRRRAPSLPGGRVRVGSAAAAGAETEAAQDGEQGGAPAQVEGGAQLVPGDTNGAGQR